MQDRFEAFTVLIAKISRSIRRIKADEMAEYDLKATHVNCLYYLYSAGGMTAAELCEKCEEDKAAISRSLEYLEANGYVEGERSAGKRYRSRLQLTEKGEKTAESIARKIDGIVEWASADISPEDREAMYRALTAISVQLEDRSERSL